MAEKMIKAKALSDGIGAEKVRAGETIEVPESQLKYFIKLGLVEELKAPKQAPKKPQEDK